MWSVSNGVFLHLICSFFHTSPLKSMKLCYVDEVTLLEFLLNKPVWNCFNIAALMHGLCLRVSCKKKHSLQR